MKHTKCLLYIFTNSVIGMGFCKEKHTVLLTIFIFPQTIYCKKTLLKKIINAKTQYQIKHRSIIRDNKKITEQEKNNKS